MNHFIHKAFVTILVVGIFIPCAGPAATPDYTRTPVLMIHGYFPVPAADLITWGSFKNKLIEDGWPEEYVMAPHFEDTTGCDPDHAREISAWVDELRQKTGFDKINIVAHSEGGLNTMYYLKYFCGVHKVENFVGLAIAIHGTRVARIDFLSCGADEMTISAGENGWMSNPVLADLNSCDETPGDVLYTSVWSEYDEIIVPQEGSKLAGAMNIEMNAVVEHGLIFLNDESFGYIKNAFLNRRGLNTDGPGWDCIPYCVVPEQADQVEMPDVPEGVENDSGGSTADTAEEVELTDVIEPVDGTGADDGAKDGTIVVPYDAGIHPYDPGPNDPGTRPDGMAEVTGDSNASIDQGTSNDEGTVNPPAPSSGCNATRTAGSIPALILMVGFALIVLRRRMKDARNT